MRIHPEVPKTVVFIGIRGPRGFLPLCTGFFISYEFDEFQFNSIVTASHAVENVTADLYARVNCRSGPADYMLLRKESRMVHPTRACDLTMFSSQVDPAKHDMFSIQLNRDLVDRARSEIGGVMPGDHICSVGLYTSHYGEISNAPVVRTGNIAAIPNEPIFTERGFAEAYLIELRTIAGLSGSPVFQTLPQVFERNGEVSFRRGPSGGNILGMLVGYHVVQSAEDQIRTPQYQPRTASSAGDDRSLDERNTGFGIVIPIERVIDILESDEIQSSLKQLIDAKKTSSGYKGA